ncbi:hypothetical protein [Trichothermofontia sp.]
MSPAEQHDGAGEQKPVSNWAGHNGQQGVRPARHEERVTHSSLLTARSILGEQLPTAGSILLQ